VLRQSGTQADEYTGVFVTGNPLFIFLLFLSFFFLIHVRAAAVRKTMSEEFWAKPTILNFESGSSVTWRIQHGIRIRALGLTYNLSY
jgi:hypothetical protein